MAVTYRNRERQDVHHVSYGSMPGALSSQVSSVSYEPNARFPRTVLSTLL